MLLKIQMLIANFKELLKNSKILKTNKEFFEFDNIFEFQKKSLNFLGMTYEEQKKSLHCKEFFELIQRFCHKNKDVWECSYEIIEIRTNSLNFQRNL